MAGRGTAAPTIIIPANNIFDVDQITHENVTLTDLGAAFSSPLDGIKWLVQRRLLTNSRICQTCQIAMSFTRRMQLNDGYRWLCKECGGAASLRNDSFFSQSHLTLKQIIIIVYGWARDYPQKDIAHEAQLGVNFEHTIVDWCSFCRDICEQYITDHPIAIGGFNDDGTSKVVEIDESKFFHRKYHRGRWRDGHWVFGGIERETGKCFLVEVADRTAETLTNVIETYILPGTLIISDGWRAYNHINEIGGGIYQHEVIIHEENFVDPMNPNVHTQNVENMWMRAKRKFRRQFGTSEALFTSYLHEFLWRNQFRNNNIFAQFLFNISEQYPALN